MASKNEMDVVHGATSTEQRIVKGCLGFSGLNVQSWSCQVFPIGFAKSSRWKRSWSVVRTIWMAVALLWICDPEMSVCEVVSHHSHLLKVIDGC